MGTVRPCHVRRLRAGVEKAQRSGVLDTCGERRSLLGDGPLPGEAPRAVGAWGLGASASSGASQPRL